MNPTAIYSKSGKGVQEASGKTSLLKRPDRAVLSAIDGRANLAEVAAKVGKSFDAAFQALITQMDKDGFIREVSAGAAPAAPAKPAANSVASTPTTRCFDPGSCAVAQPAAPKASRPSRRRRSWHGERMPAMVASGGGRGRLSPARHRCGMRLCAKRMGLSP